MDRYRQLVAGIDMPDKQKDELIDIVHALMAHFVDSAFGVQTDHISLESRKKSRFHAAFDHARIGTNPEHETVDPLTGSARNDSSLDRQIAP
jgi:hypothetical protein